MTPLVIRGIVFAGSACALATFLAQKGTGEYDLFTLHPVLMTIAFLALMGEGIVHYHVSDAAISEARKCHRNIFFAVGVLSLSGIVVILKHKADIKHAWAPQSTHSFFGIFTMCMVFFQGSVGVKKLAALSSSNGRIKLHLWHGIVGMSTFTVAACTILLGFYEILGSWTLSMGIATLSVLSVLAVVWHTQHYTERTVVDTTYGIVHERDDIDDINLFDNDVDTEPTDFA